ncbi:MULTISPECIES: FecR family protein [Butyricimonas]|uniref:FecR family protein n=1 Tax=Butyricimonas TaxID=574697 RepID=UPI001D07DF80|nr:MULTISPECIES: FecR family protein [Butyricimonas]MCB6974906.1 FecR domain-containing protein [Butyricimonas synergistica]MCG4521648.1 FecR domain-containing protein [Butyricimonas sp. DFI.6.44]
MKRIRKDIEISDLIYRSLRGEISVDEKKFLEVWCLEPKNRELFMKLREADMLYEGIADMNNVDTEAPFKKINDRIRRRKRARMMRYLSGIAATVLVGVVLILWSAEEKQQAKTIPLSSVPKGRMEPFATLVTTGGKVVYPEDSVKQLAVNTSDSKLVLPVEEKTDESQLVQMQEIEYNVLTTSKQGNIKVTLYDGSYVWLNAGSELRYPNTFVGNKRIVYLKGEAFFEVVKDADHPFVVNTASAVINVLGTSFNVSAYDVSCETTLVEGRVRMKNGKQDSVELRPGEQAFLTKYGSIGVREVDVRYSTGWMNNLFAFKEAPLREIVDVLGEWYGCTFRFEEPKVGNVLYTTMVKRYPDVDSVLRVLEGTGDFRFIKINDTIIIKEK